MRGYPASVTNRILSNCAIGLVLLSTRAPRAADRVVFGSDEIHIPSTYFLPTDQESRGLTCHLPDDYWRTQAERSPLLREGFKFGWSQAPLRQDLPPTVIGSPEKKLYVTVHWRSIGVALRPITSAKQFESVLDQMYPAWSQMALTTAQLRSMIHAAGTAGGRIPLQVLKRDFDADSLSRRCFSKDGFWLAHFALIEEASVVEYKFAIDADCHIGRIRRILVEGPPNPSRSPPLIPFMDRHGNWYAISASPVPNPYHSPAEMEYWSCYGHLYFAAHADTWRTDLRDHEKVHAGTIGAALQERPNDAKEALPFLRKALLSSDHELSFQANEVLQGLGPAAKPAIPELLKVYLNSEVAFRRRVVETFLAIGPSSSLALAQLVAGMSDSDTDIRETSARAVLLCGTPETRVKAARTLADIPYGRSSMRPELEKALDDPDANVRKAAVEAAEKLTGRPMVNAPDKP